MASFVFPLLKGKTAAITGGTTGIGRAISLEYIRQGCNVAVNHLGFPHDANLRSSLLEEAARIREESKSEEKYMAGEMIDVKGDVTSTADCKNLVQEAVDRWGKLDVFVANAGIFKPAPFLE